MFDLLKKALEGFWGDGYKTSLKFGFAGIGLMGCRVVNVISQIEKDGKQVYNTLGININEKDLEQQNYLQNKLLLKYNKHSAGGRNPAIGYEAISENKEKVQKALAELGNNSDFIWLVAGLGGGTGTGGLLQLAEWADQIKQFLDVGFGIIVSIPQMTEKKENQNALKVLSILNNLASERTIPIIVVDNELLFQKYLIDKKTNDEFTDHSNVQITNLLHRFNVITSSYIPYGSKHFDGQELKYIFENGGCIQFSRTELGIYDFKDEISLKNKLQRQIQEGIASEGYDLRDATMAGISIFVPSEDIAKAVFNADNIKIMENAVFDIIPQADVRWGRYINEDIKSIEVYIIVSGLALPSRIEDIPELVRENKLSGTAKKLNLQIVDEDENDTKKFLSDFGNPFQQKPRVVNEKATPANVPDWVLGR